MATSGPDIPMGISGMNLRRWKKICHSIASEKRFNLYISKGTYSLDKCCSVILLDLGIVLNQSFFKIKILMIQKVSVKNKITQPSTYTLLPP